jgi:hypothetical protein
MFTSTLLSIAKRANEDNLSWPVEFLVYVFNRRKHENDLSQAAEFIRIV